MRSHRSSQHTGIWIFTGLITAAILHVVAGGWSSPVFAQSEGNTTFTESNADPETIRETTTTVRSDEFETRIIGRVGSTIVFDQTFSLPFGNAAVQDAVDDARAAIETASPGSGISGPALISSSDTLLGSSSSSVDDDPFVRAWFAFTEDLHPAVIMTGDLNPCTLDPAPAAPPSAPYPGCTGGAGEGTEADPMGFDCSAASVPLICTGGTPYAVPFGIVNFHFSSVTHRDIARTTTINESHLVETEYELAATTSVCRSPGYFGTHGALVDALLADGCVEICGENIRAFGPLGSADAALEAFCVSNKKDPRVNLVRHLLAASLSCQLSGFGEDCTGSDEFEAMFALCNSGCRDQTSSTYQTCTAFFECELSGGQYDPVTGTCSTGLCSLTGAPCGGDAPPCPAQTCDLIDGCSITGTSCLSSSECEPNVCQPYQGRCNEAPLPNAFAHLGANTNRDTKLCNDANKSKCQVVGANEAECTGETGTDQSNVCNE